MASRDGKFLSMFVTSSGTVFVSEEYQLYKPTNDMLIHWSYRDKKAWKKERQYFIDHAYKFTFGKTLYVIKFDTMISEQWYDKLAENYHKHNMRKLTFDE